MEMTTMTLKVQYLTKLEEGTQIRAGWYVTTPFCPEVVFATEQEALAYGRTEELRQELMDRVRAMSFDELRALADFDLTPLGKAMRWYRRAVGDLVMRPTGMSDAGHWGAP